MAAGYVAVVNCKNGVSSYEIAGYRRHSEVRMVHGSPHSLRSRHVPTDKLSGQVEADETFIGGKARNMHVGVRQRRITGTGGKDKTAVMGILQRGGKVRTIVVPNRKKSRCKRRSGSTSKPVLLSTPMHCCPMRGWEYAHQVVDHAVKYVDGKVHTNGLENYWSLLKRGINGTYVSVEPFHLFRYLDEQSYRYNNRKMNDGERFSMAVSGIVGKRLTFNQVTGKAGTSEASNPLRLKRGKRKSG